MENASKALLMTAGILIGVLILSVGVALVNSFGGSSKNIITQIEANKISEFNNQFLKYYGKESISAHDVISIANAAKSNNIQNEINFQSGYNNKSDYIQVKLFNNGSLVKNNLEKESEAVYTKFLKDNMTNEYKCTEVITSSISGKVIYIKIENKK